MKSRALTVLSDGGPAVCRFAHPFFAKFVRNKTASFRHDHDQQTALFLTRYDASGLETVVTLSALARDLGIDEASAEASPADIAMIGMVRRAVLYVDRVYLDDVLPPEAVTGDASWYPTRAQRRSAGQTVRARIAFWVKSGGRGTTSPSREALARLSDTLSATALEKTLASSRALLEQGVVAADIDDAVGRLSACLSYVVALRDRLAMTVSLIEGAIVSVGALFGTDDDVAEIATGLARASQQFAGRLGAELDACEDELADIAGAMRHTDRVIARIARRRNTLHAELRRVEALVAVWDSDAPGFHRDQRERLFDTYRLLARRDLPSRRWLTTDERYAVTFGAAGGRRDEVEDDGRLLARRVWR